MTREETHALILAALGKVILKVPANLNPDLYLMKDLGLESIDMLNLMVEIERELKTDLDLTELLQAHPRPNSFSRDLRMEDLGRFISEKTS